MALADPRPAVRRLNSAKRSAAAARGDDRAASAKAERRISRCSASAARAGEFATGGRFKSPPEAD